MKINESFSYQFRDPEWPAKLGLGALISLVPILNVAIAGYMVQIIRNVAADAAQPLPHWDDLGDKFRDGLILAAAGLIYSMPILIAICLPLSILAFSGALAQITDLEDLGRSLGGITGVLFLCLFGLFVLYSLFLSIIRPIILIIYSRDGTFASCFRFSEILGIIGRYPGPFFSTWIVVLLAGLAIGLAVGFVNVVAGWIPCLGWIVGLVLAAASAMYIVTIDAYLFGEFREIALAVHHPAPSTEPP